jgi:hypothetical protein
MENNDKLLEEIRKYCDPNSILVIADRKLIRIHCPFKAKLAIDFTVWKKGDAVYVEKVMVTRQELLMVFLVGGIGYPYYLFKILVM